MGFTIASDALALRGHADEMLYLEDSTWSSLTQHRIDLFDRAVAATDRRRLGSAHSSRSAMSLSARYPHFMSKEMAEQPDVLERLAIEGEADIRALAEAIDESYGTFLVGCGTASYAALTGVVSLQPHRRHATSTSPSAPSSSITSIS